MSNPAAFHSRSQSVVGTPVARLTQVAMMAIFRGAPDELLELTAQLMAEVSPDGEMEPLALHVEYVLTTLPSEERRQAFAEALRRNVPGRGGDVVNYVEQIEERGRQEGHRAGREEGREEGRLEERVRTIESLLRAGAEWTLIESATGVDEVRLRALKQQLPAT